ncbi:unnamed protein product [Nezara viridula]|uniref:Uncharacterized protein n=1 Tax=Nezara viridula TaxID=85310 RepID=A0A9P0E4W9_NEZVI|nr:unnamed protein product [Nezara viridula]
MCDQTVFGNRTAPLTDEERLELYECMDECFYKATQLLTADMKLNETALIAEYDTPLENYPQWKEPMAKAVKTCIEKNVVLDVKPEAKCKSGAYQFSNCFGVNLYLNCPPENRKMDDECTKARERLEKC